MSENIRDDWPEAVFWPNEFDTDLEENPYEVVLAGLQRAVIDQDNPVISEGSFHVCDETKRLTIGRMTVKYVALGILPEYPYVVDVKASDHIIHRAFFAKQVPSEGALADHVLQVV